MSDIPEGWHIEYDPSPLPTREFDWVYFHDFHDADNGLCGTASSREHAIQYINEKDWDL